VRQSAKVVAPPSVSSQQSPHTSARQRAHGPAALAPHSRHRAVGPSPAGISDVMAGAPRSRCRAQVLHARRSSRNDTHHS
jgi:hypothetical protein